MGNEAAFGELERALGRARLGTTQIVVIEGPEGIGKTTLVNGLISCAASEGVPVTSVSGDEDEVDLPLGVMSLLLAQWDTDGGMGAAPHAAGAQLVAHWQAVSSPTVIVIEDAHWLDLSSLQALSFALRRLRDVGILAILTCTVRAGSPMPEGLSKLATDGHGQVLHLGGLTQDEVAALVEPYWGELSTAQLTRLYQHCGGHPKHTEALARDLDVAVLDTGLGRPLPVPSSISSLVLNDLATLPSDAQTLVMAAAVLGATCPVRDAIALSGLEGADELIEAAVSASILEYDGPYALRFRDSMTRSVAYYAIGVEQLSLLHRRAAEISEGAESLRHQLRGVRAGRADEQLARLVEERAESLARTGAWFEAAELLDAAHEVSATKRAAERRRWTSAMYRAYGGGPNFVNADDRLDLVSDHPIRLLLGAMAAAADSRYGQAELLAGAAWELVDPALDPDTASRIALRMSDCLHGQLRVERALVWAQRAVDVLPPGRDLPGEDPLVDLVFGLLTSGRIADALLLVEERVPIADTAAPGLLARGVVELYTDQLAASIRDLSKAADRFERFGPPHKCVEAHFLLSEAEYRFGLWDRSARHARDAISIAYSQSIPQLTALALAASAAVLAARGDGPAADAALQGALEALAQRGSYQALGWTWIAQARLESARINDQRTVDVLSSFAAIDSAGPLVDEQVLLPWRTPYALALARLGRVDEAADQAERLTKYASDRQFPSSLGAAARLRGVLAGLRGDFETAEAELTSAISEFEEIPMPFDSAQAQYELGCLLRRVGRRKEAAGHLDSARAVFVRLGATPYVERCVGEIASCGLRRKEPATGSPVGTLTATELTVAGLVAGGATNKQVAESLSMSVRTVEHHLRRTYAKLGVRSRSQLAARHEEFFDQSQ